MPRILGIEGSWGSGKSNVVNMIERELSKEGYFTFTYDAWGHQEDLQRRSILETLATNLINNKVLQGDVEIQMRNGKKHKASWKDQLSLLLSNKTTTIRKSTPRLTTAIAWFEYGFEYSKWSHAAFIKPICKDVECAKILIANKSFYFSVMRCDQTYAQTILNEIKDLEVYADVNAELEDMLVKGKEGKK